MQAINVLNAATINATVQVMQAASAQFAHSNNTVTAVHVARANMQIAVLQLLVSNNNATAQQLYAAATNTVHCTMLAHYNTATAAASTVQANAAIVMQQVAAAIAANNNCIKSAYVSTLQLAINYLQQYYTANFSSSKLNNAQLTANKQKTLQQAAAAMQQHIAQLQAIIAAY